MKILMLLFIFIFIYLNSQELQKAKNYDNSKHNITNWYMSEKLDGIRAYWNGKELLSKNGNKIKLPYWMGSLDKIKPSTNAFDKWINKFNK